jgi:hypothetical protein
MNLIWFELSNHYIFSVGSLSHQQEERLHTWSGGSQSKVRKNEEKVQSQTVWCRKLLVRPRSWKTGHGKQDSNHWHC